jgi:multiple sugar transport system substrate-binding protein
MATLAWFSKSGIIALAAALAATACGGLPDPVPPASPGQAIVFAESGVGPEEAWTQKQVDSFMRANPGIKVRIDVLSPDSSVYLGQLETAFTARAHTPDVFESDVTYTAKLAQARWALPLGEFHPATGQFFPREMTDGIYRGQVYAIPWFDNPEGLYYRTDLIKTPPRSPAQVVSDAKLAMREDPTIRDGLAFEGNRYEGAVTAFLTVGSAFGGSLNLADIDTRGNVAALTWLHNAIYVSHIARPVVAGWQEGEVEQEFVQGHAAFAIDYPFVESLATESPVKGHVGYIPFPAGPGGTPGAALGGEMLAINAKTAHAAAAWKLIQYLTRASAEIARAEVTGDPPSLPSAYTSALYAKAPYFRSVKTLNSYTASRPVNPYYPVIANTELYPLFAVAYSSPATAAPAQALKAAAPTVRREATGIPPRY